MAHVTGPLMSIGARGTVGEALIYSQNKRRNTVKAFATPSQPGTLGQMYARAKINLINKIWQNIDQIYRNAWNPIAKSLNITAPNAQTQAIMAELQAEQWPKASPNYPATQPTPNTSTFDITITGHTLTGTVHLTAPSDPQDIVTVALELGLTSQANRPRWTLWSLTGQVKDAFDFAIHNIPSGGYRTRGFYFRPNGTHHNVTGKLDVIIAP